jgi:hypothetical protein
VFADERTCPHCGAALRSSGGVAKAAVLVGLALTGCPNNVEPVYGVPESDSESTTGGNDDVDNTGEAEYGVPDTGDFSTSDSSTSTGEPEYGGPDTGESTSDSSTSDTTGEPEYGVPDTGTDTGTTAEPLYGVADSGEQ